jgi:hypothetical protein
VRNLSNNIEPHFLKEVGFFAFERLG